MTELLIKGGCVVTMDPSIGDFASADVHVRDGRLVAVAPQLDVPGAEVIDAVGKIVIPGLVDGHRHVWQSLLRGVSVDWSLSEYMIEARSMYCGCFEPEDAYAANYLGGLEAVAAGITTLVDHSHLQASPAMSDALAAGLPGCSPAASAASSAMPCRTCLRIATAPRSTRMTSATC